MNDEFPFRSASDRNYWVAFETRLRTKVATSSDSFARAELVALAYSDMTHDAFHLMEPEAHADLVYRLRYELGPTVDAATLHAMRADLEAERERLLREGVSPILLGLTG